MPVLNDINIPLEAIPGLLKNFGYDPEAHGTSPAEKEAFIRARVIEFLKATWRRGDRSSHFEAYANPATPDIS
jgi:hypothetical protein